MARRLSVREDTHYVVKYLCDCNIQIRSRVFFKTDSPILVGKEYDVQWGRPKDVDRVIVLHSGSETDMRSKKKEVEEPTPPSSPLSPRSPSLPPRSPSPSPLPKPKRRKIEKSTGKTGKPRAIILAVGSAPTEQRNPAGPLPEPLTPLPEPRTPSAPLPEPSTPLPEPQTPSTPLPEPRTPSAPLPEPQTPSTPLPEPRTPVTSTPRADVRFRPFRPSTSTGDDNSLVPVLLKEVQEQRQTIDMMNRKLDASNRRTASLELQLKTVLANTNVLIDVMRKLANENSAICQMPSGSDDNPTDSTPQGIPEEFQLEDSYLRKTLHESRNSGNFAVNLTRTVSEAK